MKRVLLIILVGVLVMVGLGCAKPPAVTPAPILTPTPPKIFDVTWTYSGSPGSTTHQQAMVITTLAEKYSKWVRVTPTPGKGTTEITAWTQDGKISVGNSSSMLVADFLAGVDFWAKRPPFTDVQIMWPSGKMVSKIFVPKDSPIQTIYDFKGKSIAVGDKIYSTCKSTWLLFGELLYKPGEVDLVYTRPSKEIGEALKAGRVDAGGGIGGIGVAWEVELCLLKDIRIVDIPVDVVEKLAAEFPPGAILPFTIKKGSYKGMERDVQSYFRPGIWITKAGEIPDDVGYELAKVQFDHPEEARQLSEFMVFMQDIEFLVSQTWAPLHPGVERYFKERGWVK